MSSLLLDESLPADQRDFVETIRNSGEALLSIINDILDFSKMEQRKMELETQPFNLRACVEESMDLVAAAAAERSLNLAYIMDVSTPEIIIGDPAKLRQVLVNLLSNAVKFTETGEVLLSVGPSGKEDEILFEVKDTGIGIPADKMDRLFESFSQVDTSISSKYGGTGLGLSISKRLVELMGGQISVQSQLGNGSTFYFTIKAETAPSGSTFPTGVQPRLKGKRIFIFDDSRTNRRIIGLQAHDWGMVPLITSRRQDALGWIYSREPFDAAIVGGADGPALVSEIRRYHKTMPLLLISNKGCHISEPSITVLSKPIKPLKLYDFLIGAISSQAAGEAAVEASDSEPESQRALRILLAEDNSSSQKVILQMLKKLGLRADVAANGIEAVAAVKRQPYDLILMDVRMPDMDGLEATRAIRKILPNDSLKIIAITAYALGGDRERCLDAGMDDYIPKPVKLEELKAVLERNWGI
jgi:CheY-like chemotaxis protein